MNVPLLMPVVLDVIFALSKGIPEFNSPIAGSGHDLSVVRAKAHRQNVGGVPDEATGGETGVEVPKTECMVPRR